MLKTVTATQARIHFGQLMRQAQDEPIVVERDGKAEVVVLSKQAFDRLAEGGTRPDWRELLAKAHNRIRQDLAGRSLPPIEEVLHQLREERYDDYDSLH